MKTREIFVFLPLISNSVAIGLSFLLLSISATVSSNIKKKNLFGLYSSIFFKISFISFEYSIKAFESFKYFKPILFILSLVTACNTCHDDQNETFKSFALSTCVLFISVNQLVNDAQFLNIACLLFLSAALAASSSPAPTTVIVSAKF